MTKGKQVRGVDFHCHIDLHRKPLEVISRCAEEQVVTVAVTTTPKAWPQNHAWTKDSRYVHAAVGLHPELVGDRGAEIEMLERRIARLRLVGEVGLDGSRWHRHSYEKQLDVFSRTLDAAQHHRGRVLSIHSRQAERDVIRLVKERTDPSDVLCILHWFSGSMASVHQAIEAGCYFSVNPAMLRNDGGRALVRELAPDRLLTETDAPFSKNTVGRQAVPWDVLDAAPLIAMVTGRAIIEVVDQIAANARRVFRFAGVEL